MSWETRGGNGPYYTRSRKRRGKVMREYIGGGIKGAMMAAVDDEKREERQAELDARREVREAATLLDEFCRLTTAAARAAIEAAGYHNHKGQWRKRRARNDRS